MHDGEQVPVQGGDDERRGIDNPAQLVCGSQRVQGRELDERSVQPLTRDPGADNEIGCGPTSRGLSCSNSTRVGGMYPVVNRADAFPRVSPMLFGVAEHIALALLIAEIRK